MGTNIKQGMETSTLSLFALTKFRISGERRKQMTGVINMPTLALDQAIEIMNADETKKLTRYANWILDQRASSPKLVSSRAVAMNQLRKHRGILGDVNTDELLDAAIREKYGNIS